MNERLSAAAAFLLYCAGTAFGADLDPPKMSPVAPAPIWTGFHIGLNVGYSWTASGEIAHSSFPAQTALDGLTGGTHGFASTISATGVSNVGASGPLGGGQIGFDGQFDRFLIGVEADIQGVGGRGRGGFLGGAEASTLGFVTDSVFTGVELRKSVDWLGTARGRIGYLLGPALLGYATGGLAYGGVAAGAAASQGWNGAVGTFLQSSGATGGLSETRLGWTLGGGAEWAFARNLSVKIEYLYYDLGVAQFASSPLDTSLFGGLSDTVVSTTRTRFNGHLARLGLNYRLTPSDAAGTTPPSSAPPPPLWTGFYAGLNAGYSFDGEPNVLTSAFPVRSEIDALLTGSYTGLPHSAALALASTGVAGANAEGYVAGGQIGFNYRWDRLLGGLEADIHGAGVRGRGGFLGSASAPVGGSADMAISAVENEKTIDWLGSVRGRIGYLVNPALLAYATGGLAYGGVTAHTTIFTGWGGNVLGPLLRSTNSVGSRSDTLLGWTIGAGAEWALTPRLSVKAEYLFYDLGAERYASSPSSADLLGFFSNIVLPISQTRFQGHIIRAGVNYHFRLFDSGAHGDD